MYTGRVCTVVAPGDLKKAPCVREDPFFGVLHPRPVDAERHFIFGLAGSGAGVATDTLPVIDEETVVHDARR
jgi:hypothetical protein